MAKTVRFAPIKDIDISELITFDPLSTPICGSGYCDLYIADMQGVGKVALKKMRLLGTMEKTKSLCSTSSASEATRPMAWDRARCCVAGLRGSSAPRACTAEGFECL